MKIEVKNLSKYYGNHCILKEMDCTIESGKFTCIFGESGSGKTTLLNIMGMIEEYKEGEIFYDGKKIESEKEKAKMLSNSIGFVFQNFGLMENKSVKENLMIVKKVRKSKNPKELINEALNYFGLMGMENQKVCELSGGEQQRVALAKLMIKDCDLILADEPTASLDEDNKQLVVKTLKDFVAKGKTVIVVSHDRAISDVSDSLIVLRKERGT